MVDISNNSAVLNYFESEMKDFIVKRLSHVKNWWNACIPPKIREDASQRYQNDKKVNDILNKPDFVMVDYLNFDGYEKIIARQDNWNTYFEDVFLDKSIFLYKMRVLLSLRNDIRHGRTLDEINSIRLRIHCYDILSQIHETIYPDKYDRNAMLQKLGFQIR